MKQKKTKKKKTRIDEYIDGKMLKNVFIVSLRPHVEFINIVWFPRLIYDRRLTEGAQKKRPAKLKPELRNIPPGENQIASSVLSSNRWRYDLGL